MSGRYFVGAKKLTLLFWQLSFMIQYCYTSLVLATKGSVTEIKVLCWMYYFCWTWVDRLKETSSQYIVWHSVTLNYNIYILAHEEILKCKLTNFSVSIHSEYLQLTYSILSFNNHYCIFSRTRTVWQSLAIF